MAWHRGVPFGRGVSPDGGPNGLGGRACRKRTWERAEGVRGGVSQRPRDQGLTQLPGWRARRRGTPAPRHLYLAITYQCAESRCYGVHPRVAIRRAPVPGASACSIIDLTLYHMNHAACE